VYEEFAVTRWNQIKDDLALDGIFSSGGGWVAGVGSSGGFDEEEMYFVDGDGAMFYTARYDVEFAWV